MPLTVELLVDASYQDQQDLQKIYLDAPHWLLSPFPDATALIAAALVEGSFVVGRFNDRLLGAARIQRSAATWQLSHLCVRRQTRRRGIALRLVEEARRQAEHAGCLLQLQGIGADAAALALAEKAGLVLEGC